MGMMLFREPSGLRTKLELNLDGTTTSERWAWKEVGEDLILKRNGANIFLKKQGKSWVWEEDRKVILSPMQARRLPKPVYNSHIGDIIARRFEALGIKPIAGCPCKNLQGKLDTMTPEAVMSDIAGLTVKLRNSAKKWKELKGGVWNFIPAPPLWLCRRVLEDAVKEAKGIIAAEQLTSVAEPGK